MVLAKYSLMKKARFFDIHPIIIWAVGAASFVGSMYYLSSGSTDTSSKSPKKICVENLESASKRMNDDEISAFVKVDWKYNGTSCSQILREPYGQR